LALLLDRFVFFPDRSEVGPSPGLDVVLTVADGIELHGWYLDCHAASVTLLHLHGNAGNLEGRRALLNGLRALGVNVFAIDYRGYGRSTGQPSEEGLYADANAAYDWIRVNRATKLVIHGESLGGAVGCHLASVKPCDGLIAQSTFTSVRDLIPRGMRFLSRFGPTFDSLARIDGIACPKLFMHSRSDEMIPFAMGSRLFEAARPPKESAWLDHVGHNEMLAKASSEFYKIVGTFLESLTM
jgi:fermentation-respiration switch protein FrsA (DUF1100 family)